MPAPDLSRQGLRRGRSQVVCNAIFSCFAERGNGEVRPLRMLIYIAEIDKYCGAASCVPRFNIACLVTDHKAFVQSTRAARRRGAACLALACDSHIHRSANDSRPRTHQPARSSPTAGAISSTTLRPNSTALHSGLVDDDDQSKNYSLIMTVEAAASSQRRKSSSRRGA